jgi:hypothetical protein
MIYAGQSNMKRVWLEAGGKSPNIVFADAPDLKKRPPRLQQPLLSIRAKSARPAAGCWSRNPFVGSLSG